MKHFLHSTPMRFAPFLRGRDPDIAINFDVTEPIRFVHADFLAQGLIFLLQGLELHRPCLGGFGIGGRGFRNSTVGA